MADWPQSEMAAKRMGAPGPNREDGRDSRADMASGLGCQGAADIDEVVADDAQTHPSLHSAVSFVATTVQPVASLEHADAAFTAGPPFLSVLEPACFLERCAIFTLTRAVGHGNAFHSHLVRLLLAAGGIERCVTGHQVGDSSQTLLVDRNRGGHQIAVGGALIKDFVIDDKLPLRFLHLDHLAKFGRLLRLAAPDDFGGVLKHAGQFSCYMRIAAEHPRPRLKPHLLPPTMVSSSFFIPSSAACFLISALRLTPEDRKSTRLNSSHRCISYAVFCLKK